jgi:NADH:quinone reductase (non-electrogenic)
VATSWSLDLLLPPELVELKLAGSMGVTQEHFEPGQEIFHQGDLGDRMYIILSGQADVLREEHGGETLLAEIGAGEYFGEMALLNQTTRGATVRCKSAMQALSLPKGEFGVLAAHMPELRQSLDGLMERRTQANARMRA